MGIEIKEVSKRSELRKFIYIPGKIHKKHNSWLHPIYSDEWTLFNPKKNRSFSYCDTLLALALKDGKVVGRIMGIINKKYNEIHDENTARYVFMETFDDQEVFRALIRYVENWARNKGMTKIIGPFGFTDKDPQGFLVDGFDEFTVMITNCNFQYMIDYIVQEGYTPLMDLVQYRAEIPSEIPEIYSRILKRLKNNGYKLLEFTSRKKLKPYIVPVFELTNETYTNIYGYVPYDDKEMRDFANRYLPILDPRLIKIITLNNEVIAYVIGMPNISEGIRKAKGRLFPFGFIKILRSMKKTKQLDMLLGAVKPRYRNKGIDSLLAIAMLRSAYEIGLEIIDSHLIMESNTKMRAEYERMGGEIYKRYRVFQKVL